MEECESTENEDYEVLLKNEKNLIGGRPMQEYIIKLDTAKEMAMLERNEKGKQVRRYFIQVEKKYKQGGLEDLSPELKAVIVVDRRITKAEKRLDRLEYDIPLYGSEADELCSHVKRRGVAVMGGKATNAYRDSRIRATVYADIYSQIKREFGLYDDKGRMTSYKALKRRYIYEAHELVDCYELPTYLAEQVQNCNAQMNIDVA